MLVFNQGLLRVSESVRRLASTSWRESLQSKGVVGTDTHEAELVGPTESDVESWATTE